MDLSKLVQSQAASIVMLSQQNATLKHQLEWFKRQVFGQKSERFAPQPDPTQMHLGEAYPVPSIVPETRKAVPAHTRRVPKTDLADTGETVPFFDESRVPVETITLIEPKTRFVFLRTIANACSTKSMLLSLPPDITHRFVLCQIRSFDCVAGLNGYNFPNRVFGSSPGIAYAAPRRSSDTTPAGA